MIVEPLRGIRSVNNESSGLGLQDQDFRRGRYAANGGADGVRDLGETGADQFRAQFPRNSGIVDACRRTNRDQRSAQPNSGVNETGAPVHGRLGEGARSESPPRQPVMVEGACQYRS